MWYRKFLLTDSIIDSNHVRQLVNCLATLLMEDFVIFTSSDICRLECSSSCTDTRPAFKLSCFSDTYV